MFGIRLKKSCRIIVPVLPGRNIILVPSFVCIPIRTYVKVVLSDFRRVVAFNLYKVYF